MNIQKTKLKTKELCPSCGRYVLTLYAGNCIQCKCEQTIPQIKLTKFPTKRGIQ